MTFLPIVVRELRVAARRRGNYWMRVAVAGIAFVLFAGILIVFELSQGFFGFSAGPVLFSVFSWLAFIFSCAAGVFFTSDTLSEEKREGTLGLLFLTDLRGYDVVCGKVMANSLRCVFGLLAAFPVMGISFLLGGVTGSEFWRLALALLNTLFFMLTAGAFISSISRESGRAMTGTAVLTLIFLGLLPTADWWLAGWNSAAYRPILGLASPGLTFSEFQNPRSADFWTSLALTHGLGWVFLVLACVLTPRLWRDKSVQASGRKRWWLGSAKGRAAWRTRLLAANPVRWLAAREPWTARLLLIMLAVAGAAYALLSRSFGTTQVAISVGEGAVSLAAILVFLWLAAQASRFFVDGARSGTLELMLATPLPPRDIVLGQVWALQRVFLVPMLVLVVVNSVLQIAQLNETINQFAATNATTAVAANTEWQQQMITFHVIAMVQSIASFLTGFLAYAWCGMWMGLTTRKPNVAVIKTVVFVTVLPWFTMMFLQIVLQVVLFSRAAAGGQIPFWVPQVVAGVLLVGVQIAFWLLARRRLLGSLRETFARASGLGQRPSVAPPTLSAAAAP